MTQEEALARELYGQAAKTLDGYEDAYTEALAEWDEGRVRQPIKDIFVAEAASRPQAPTEAP